MEQDNKNLKVIDLTKIIKTLLKHKKAYMTIMPIVFVISCIFILSQPRYYRSEVKLAPEWNDPSGSMSGSLSSLASSFGVNLGGKMTSIDAFSPELYPDIVTSSNFIVKLFPTKITTKDKVTTCNYYTYIKDKQKSPWWNKIIEGAKGLFVKKKQIDTFNGVGKVNTFMLTKTQDDIVQNIKSKIKCAVDKKTSVISITVEDQDPCVSAEIAILVKKNLQSFITDYRTSKARKDLDYTKKLYLEAKSNYEKARRLYASYSDANQDVMLESYKSKVDDLENDMQLKYNIYSMLTTQLQQAMAKVQERTPAFTELTSASVPQKPAGPKRMIFVLAIMVICFIIISFYMIIKEK